MEGIEVAPYIGAMARLLDTNAFTETDAGIFSLSADASTIAQLEVGPGVKLKSVSYESELYNVEFGAEFSYAYLASGRDHITNIDLLGTSISARTADVGRHVGRIGAQIEISNKENTSSGIIEYRGKRQLPLSYRKPEIDVLSLFSLEQLHRCNSKEITGAPFPVLAQSDVEWGVVGRPTRQTEFGAKSALRSFGS